MSDFSRRGVLTALSLGVIASSCLWPAEGSAKSHMRLPTDRPNFFLSMTDDSDVRMPRSYFFNQKTRVANRGRQFTNCHVEFSKCEESRATFLLGQAYHNHLVKGYADLKPKEAQTLALAMQAAGWFTIIVGKVQTDYGQVLNAQGDLNHVPPGYDYSAIKFEVTGPFRYTDPHYSVNGVISRYHGYATDIETQFALTGLALAAASGKPVFLVVCWTSCHGNGFGGLDDSPEPRADNQIGWLDDVTYPHQPNWGSSGISNKPAWVGRLPAVDAEAMNILYRNRLRCTATTPDGRGGTVDDGLGLILDFFDTNGWTLNTYILCTDDNGYMLGEFNYVGKIKGYRESTGVVFDMCGPKITAGPAISAPIQNTDWVATVADLAGISVPLLQDGKSLVPLFSGTVPLWWRTAMFIETEQFKGLHSQGWTYIVTDDSDGHFVEVYDIVTDRYEKFNKVNDSHYTPLIPQLDTVLQQLSTGAGQSMWYAGALPASPV